MRKKLVIIATAFAVLTFAQIVHACEPCEKVLTLEETIEQADLIVVGKKYGNGPLSGPENQPNIYGPEWISVQVEKVLKGETNKDKIKVNSWSGMCGYGIVIDDEERYLIFMEKGDVRYNSVQWGCSVTKLPIVENGVVTEGTRFTIDEFAQYFGLRTIDQDIDKKTQPNKVTLKRNKRADLWLRDVSAVSIFVALFVALGITALKWKKSAKNNSK